MATPLVTAPQNSTTTSFRKIYTHLLHHPHSSLPHRPPPRSPSPPTPPPLLLPPDTISSLRVHPTLESALHILNNDLPSAHFLLRKMQAPPALEGMYLHGLLHVLEGDLANARAWMGDVRGAEGGGGVVRAAAGRGASLRSSGARKEGMEKEGYTGPEGVKAELAGLVELCVGRFGEGVCEDARVGYVRSGEGVQRIKEGMVLGGEGWRRF
ncbi:hypothetical protein DFH27DRAFT_640829 [Peziza echinospora]|nr:hypothetical protein DFH27DRAFT_640829 [Peziza echinospora]